MRNKVREEKLKNKQILFLKRAFLVNLDLVESLNVSSNTQ